MTENNRTYSCPIISHFIFKKIERQTRSLRSQWEIHHKNTWIILQCLSVFQFINYRSNLLWNFVLLFWFILFHLLLLFANSSSSSFSLSSASTCGSSNSSSSNSSPKGRGKTFKKNVGQIDVRKLTNWQKSVLLWESSPCTQIWARATSDDIFLLEEAGSNGPIKSFFRWKKRIKCTRGVTFGKDAPPKTWK